MNRRAAWRSIRFKTAVPAAFEAGVRGMGIIRDISRTGLWMFGAAAQVSEGERATVTVRQPDSPPIVLRGKVRRALRYGFSVEFDAPIEEVATLAQRLTEEAPPLSIPPRRRSG
jgi:hypothetical protein